MSGKATGWALYETAVKLPPVSKLVLIALSDEANSDGLSCYPSHDRIGEAVGCDRRTVMRHIAALEEHGLIVVDRPARPGRGRHNRYGLVMNDKTIDQQIHALIAERSQFGLPSMWCGNDLDEKVTESHTMFVDNWDVDNSRKVTERTRKVTGQTKKGDTAVSHDPSLPIDRPVESSPDHVDYSAQANSVRAIRSQFREA